MDWLDGMAMENIGIVFLCIWLLTIGILVLVWKVLGIDEF